MLYLLLSILCATSLVIILRLFDKWKIETSYGIVFNYLVCCITGIFSMDNRSMLLQIPSWNGWWICLLLGIWFMFIFILIGRSVKLSGVATTSIAFKLSFIIPSLSAILFYGDKFSFYNAVGFVIAVFAIYLISYEPGEKNIRVQEEKGSAENSKSFSERAIQLLPLFIFIGAGLNDALFNYIQRNFTPPGFEHIVSITIFAGAFLSGFVYFGSKKEMYQWKNIAGGIILGVPNYGSLYFLMQALKHSAFPPSTLFPINNLGIVCLSVLAGLFFFREQFSRRKLAGFILAITCILLIGFVK